MNPVEFRNEVEELHTLAKRTRSRLHTELAELRPDSDEPPVLLEAMAEILAIISEIERRLSWMVSQ